MTRFALLRHMQTEWNRLKKIQGVGDSPLTAEGRAMARQWAALLKPVGFDRIVHSDLGRARDTALIINDVLGVPAVPEPRIREQDWGRWTGRTVAGLRRDEPALVQDNEAAGWGFQPPDGEDRLAVWERGSRALLEAAAAWPGGTILVVTHEGVIKCLLNRLCGREFLPWEPLLHRKDRLHWLHAENGILQVEQIDALGLS